MKTIFHLDNTEKWQQLIGNIKNLIKEHKNHSYDIIILANSNAVKLYLEESIINDINSLSSTNIIFKACNNSLESFKINKKNLAESIVVVGAGVYELTLRQHEGYAYIKL